MKRLLLLTLSIALIFSALSFPVKATREKGDFLRGIWVSSVVNLDYPSAQGLSAEELKAEADRIITDCINLGMNAIFFQVRPCADALYDSELFPASVYLTGESTFDPLPFDPLEYFVKEGHRRGLEIHAWLNPYRVTRMGEKEFEAISEKSPAKLHPEYLLKSGANYFFNPALPEVRRLILDGVKEIIENYDVDGIHFDDYFYPDGDYDDSAAYEEYGGGQPLAEWRCENVNTLVRGAHELIKTHDPELQFGISPRGIWANSYQNARGSATRGGGSLTEIYCDSLRFIEDGWVDYICPQIYWNIGYSIADYQILLPWWVNAVKGSGVRLYIGMADYRSAEADEGDVWYGTAEIERQLELNKSYMIDGEVHFRYKSISGNPELSSMYHRRYDVPGTAMLPSGATEKVKMKLSAIVRNMIFGKWNA